MTSTPLPRVVIAAPGSGHGKTTVATGLMAALRTAGLEVAGFKVGPDFIDPGYHALATGRPGRNLDPYLCGEERLIPLLLHGARSPAPADLAVIEGVMGLYDGQLGTEGFASTAHVAEVISAPVILVVDVSHMSRTTAAIVHGLAVFDPGVAVRGVILNKAGSPRHAAEAVRALEGTGVEVLGVLPRDAGIEVPSRHLGLVPAAERSGVEAQVAALGARVAETVDLTAVVRIAHGAPALAGTAWTPETELRPAGPERPVIAVAGGRAFTFRYPETDELLRAAGCLPVVFDPLTDTDLPPGTAGLYLGGGFPEVHSAELSRNLALRARIAAAVRDGLPTVAECAGLLYLCASIDGTELVGALPAVATMTPRLTLGYRTGVAVADHLLGPAGTRVTGHEFHRTEVAPSGPPPTAGWLLDGRPDGVGTPSLHASYLHVHWAGHPLLAARFAAAARAFDTRAASGADVDLDHHGDADIGEGLLDLAVNVRVERPPDWLVTVLRRSLDEVAAYPRVAEAAKAIAAAHRLELDQVLPTAGGAEAFTLVARAFAGRRAVVVHPQFTEPEAALRASGAAPRRLVLPAPYDLRAADVPDDADLVLIGNPTNPTSVLHPAAELRRLLRPGRIVVVDEAFMDAVPGEPESLIGPDLRGLVVVRSLTKTWGLAGVRAGYVVGDPELVAAIRAQQPPWSVSTPALAATVACLTEAARAEAAAAAVELTDLRAALVARLAEVGLPVVGAPAAPFVLVDARAWPGGGRPSGWLRAALRNHGIAVRRGETFPGLDADRIRIAVRDAATTARLGGVLERLRP